MDRKDLVKVIQAICEKFLEESVDSELMHFINSAPDAAGVVLNATGIIAGMAAAVYMQAKGIQYPFPDEILKLMQGDVKPEEIVAATEKMATLDVSDMDPKFDNIADLGATEPDLNDVEAHTKWAHEFQLREPAKYMSRKIEYLGKIREELIAKYNLHGLKPTDEGYMDLLDKAKPEFEERARQAEVIYPGIEGMVESMNKQQEVAVKPAKKGRAKKAKK